MIGHNNLAVIRFYQRDCSGALQAIPQAVEIFPQQVVYRHNYALFAMYASDFDTAAAVLASMTSSSVSFSNARPSKPPLI